MRTYKSLARLLCLVLESVVMAIYHLHVKIIQRSKGKNVIAAAAYRRAADLFDEREQRHWDYTNKPDVIHSEIMVPENAPDWAKDYITKQQLDPSKAAEQLWNHVDAAEKRVDSQLAREIEFALPIELSLEQNIHLAREFISDQFVLRGMIADWNIHWDEGNPHVHVMLTMRELTESGFGKRVLAWNNKALLQEWRLKWAEYANFHLRMHEQDVSIDHRSYQEQGIELVPSVHLGKAVIDMSHRGMTTSLVVQANGIRQENLARISAKPEILFNKLSNQTGTFTHQQLGQELGRYVNDQGRFSIAEKNSLAEGVLANFENLSDDLRHHDVLTPESIAKLFSAIEHHDSVFTEKTLAKTLLPFTDNAEQFAEALIKIKASSELIYLGPGDDGRDRFTTQRMFNLENDIQRIADKLRDVVHVGIASPQIQEILEKQQTLLGKQLTEEQVNAVNHILKPSSVSCIVGRAGTGKSFSLGIARAVWEAQGLRVLGVALSGIAADGLTKDAGIVSRTIESFRYALAKKQLLLTHRDVVVMDEAGMTDSVSMLSILEAVEEAKAKLVLVGDHAQLQPVGPGASFRALLERLGFAELQTVYRQRVLWQREATVNFSAGRVKEGLEAYDSHECIHFDTTPHVAMTHLVNDWLRVRASQIKDLSHYLVVAHRNDDVDSLNSFLRAERIKNKEIVDGYQVRTKNGLIKIAVGERLLFLKNNRRLGVSNGRFATIKQVEFTESGNVINFTVLLDGTLKEVQIDPNKYRDFTYGYAATVHKTQGMTVDHSFVYAGGVSWNRHLTYVALSRHRENCHVYADKETYRDMASLTKRLGRLGVKDSLLDFPLAFAERRGIDTSGLGKLLPHHLAERLALWKEKITMRHAAWVDPEGYATRLEETVQKKLAIEATQERRQDARLVAAYVDANAEVGKTWQALQLKLSDLGLDKITYDDYAFGLISSTLEYSQMQAAFAMRNDKASLIMQAPNRYQLAIDLYGLDLKKLQGQANQSACAARVKTLSDYHQRGMVVLRDRLAAEISVDVKGHYAYLKAAGLDGRALKTNAISHLKRQLFITLSADECDAFKVVENYQITMQRVGELWAAQNKAEKSDGLLQRHEFKRLERAGLDRDQLAYCILQDRQRYDKALDFFQIGIATSRFGLEKPTEKMMQEAEARWYKLQQSAARYEIRARVQAYFMALSNNNNTMSRLNLAHEIVQDTRVHHGAVIQLGDNTQEIWRFIRRDATLYERYERYHQLDLVDRLGFKTVESYVEAKRAHANAWREIFESKKTTELDEKTFYTQLVFYAHPYTQARNQLAGKILDNVTLHQAGLDYFKINLNELNAQAYAFHCREDVENYLLATPLLSRSELALKIIYDPKAHHGAVIEKGLIWRDIYRVAKLAERKQLFSTLNQEGKSLHRLAEHYRKANQAAGKLFSRLKETQKNVTENSSRIDHLFAKRDYLAWHFVNLAKTIYSDDWHDVTVSLRFKAEKLLQQQARHSERLGAIEHCQRAYDHVFDATRNINSAFKESPEMAEKTVQKALSALEVATITQKIYRVDKPASLHYALHVHGLSLQKLTQQSQGLLILKASLQSLVKLNHLNEKVLTEKLAVDRAHTLHRLNPAMPRIDLKRLKEDLNARAEDVTQHYLGEPKTRQGSTWRYGSNQGSLVVNVHGSKQGLWRDFQTSDHGDMLSLIQHALNTSQFKEVLHEANRFLGGFSTHVQPLVTSSPRKVSDLDAYTLEKIKKANFIYNETLPIKATLAERYLREHRGIQAELNDKTFRYHPALKNWMTGDSYPALIIAARNEKDQVCGIQAIFLDPKTAKKAPLGNHTKLSRGLIREGAKIQSGTPQGKIALAEGPETALSVVEAHPDWTVFVTFGVSNFANVALKTKSSSILICADNDGQNSGTAKSVERAAKILSEQGIDVWVAEPEKSQETKKWDFNDALLTQGIEKVKEDLDNAVLYKAGLTKERLNQEIEIGLSMLTTSSEMEQKPILADLILTGASTQSATFEEILKRYVNMELEQTRLVHLMYDARFTDKQKAQEYSAQAIQHSKAIKTFAAEAMGHSNIKAEVESLKTVRPSTLAQRGGFISIQERFAKGEIEREDIQILVVQLRSKAVEQSRSEVRDRDRGGRTR